MQRSVTESQKKRVAGRQRYTCAASVPEYTCPMKKEPFDESGYEIDHIKELRDGGTNDISNLQALCISCHRVKTSRMTSTIATRAPPTSPIIENLDAFRYTPKAVPTIPKLCHHCHDQHKATILRNIDGFLFCNLHNPVSCKYLGCLGKKDVHVKVLHSIATPSGRCARGHASCARPSCWFRPVTPL